MPAQKPQIIPLRTRVMYEGNETIVVGNDCEGWVMILIAPYMKRANGGNFNSEDIQQHLRSNIAPEYVGQRGFWLSPKQVAASLQILGAIPNKPDGCTCIRCTKFSRMSTNNLSMVNADHTSGEVPKTVTRAFICFSCRDSNYWWIAAHGWTYTG